jgi:tRNA(Ile)-lysidine synthase
MASSKKSRSADLGAAVDVFLGDFSWEQKRVCVGLSGGVDSVALLHVLYSLKGKRKYSLRAIHVHHGLSPNADDWTRFCRKYCRRLAVPHAVRRVKVARQGKGLEAAAREARYAAFREVRGDALVLAHHMDDQAETVLMKLARGAGTRGLAGIYPEVGIPHSAFSGQPREKAVVRPLLAIRRERFIDYLTELGQKWREDSSNRDLRHTRNRVRHGILPRLDRHVNPSVREALAEAAEADWVERRLKATSEVASK